VFIFKRLLVIIFFISAAVFSDDKQTQNIKKISEKIINLELSIDLGVDNFSYLKELREIDRELQRIQTSISFKANSKSNNWNDSEKFLLDAKNKIDALENKLKLEGDWGHISLRFNPLKKIDPNIRYRYPF